MKNPLQPTQYIKIMPKSIVEAKIFPFSKSTIYTYIQHIYIIYTYVIYEKPGIGDVKPNINTT